MNQLWAMRIFTLVAKCESFARAADTLEISKATVTTCVRNLEEHLGITLIHRNSRYMNLTEEGEIYLQKALEILSLVDQANSLVKDRNSLTRGNLCVELPFALGQLICSQLPNFFYSQPLLTLSISLTNHSRSLIKSGTDIAIRMDSVDDADVVTRSICQVRYVTCTSSKTFGQDDLPKSPIDLDPMQCLGLLSENRYIPMDWQFTSNNNHLKIYPEGPMLINSSETLIQMAINNRWIICVLEIFARKYLKSGELINLFPEWQCGVRTFQLVTPKTHYVTPKIRVFSDFILKVFDNQTPPNSNAKVNLRSHKKTTYKLP